MKLKPGTAFREDNLKKKKKKKNNQKTPQQPQKSN